MLPNIIDVLEQCDPFGLYTTEGPLSAYVENWEDSEREEYCKRLLECASPEQRSEIRTEATFELYTNEFDDSLYLLEAKKAIIDYILNDETKKAIKDYMQPFDAPAHDENEEHRTADLKSRG